MPSPTASQVHVDTLLTNASVGYKNADYIADQAFPIVPVNKQSDLIAQLTQSAWFRDEAKLRAPGTYAVAGGYGTDNTAKYFCDNYAFSKVLPDEVRDNAGAPYDLERTEVEYVTDKLQMNREVKFATDFFTSTGVWGTDTSVGTVWSNYSGSSPLTDIEGFKDSVSGKIGLEPNSIIIGREVLTQAKWHPDVVDTIKYTQRGVVSEDLLASLFGVDRLLVGRGIYTTSKEGVAETSVSYSRIWGKHLLIFYRPAAASLRSPSAGYTFVWQKYGGIQAAFRHRDNRAHADIFEVQSYYDQKALALNAGLFSQSIVA